MTCAVLPFAGARISSPFGWRTLGGERDLHTGIDLPGARGTPIGAVLPGVVVAATKISGYGNAVILQHEPELFSLSGHLDTVRVKRGQSVRLGSKLGTMGGTGWRPDEPNRLVPIHLHFEFLDQWPPAGRDQNRLDPIEVFARFGVDLQDRTLLAACSPIPPASEFFATAFRSAIRPVPWS